MLLTKLLIIFTSITLIMNVSDWYNNAPVDITNAGVFFYNLSLVLCWAYIYYLEKNDASST